MVGGWQYQLTLEEIHMVLFEGKFKTNKCKKQGGRVTVKRMILGIVFWHFDLR